MKIIWLLRVSRTTQSHKKNAGVCVNNWSNKAMLRVLLGRKSAPLQSCKRHVYKQFETSNKAYKMTTWRSKRIRSVAAS